METTQIDALTDKIVELLKDHRGWILVNENRAIYKVGSYSVFLDRDGETGKLYRITWQNPEKVMWSRDRYNKKETTPGFEQLEEACETLFNFFRERLCEFSLEYIICAWSGIQIAQATVAVSDSDVMKRFKWILEQELQGKWLFSHNTNVFWFECEDDAALYKLTWCGSQE